MLECALFSYRPQSIHEITSYAAIPENRYIDLFKLDALDKLRDLASVLGCEPNRSFNTVQEIASASASIARAGETFEHALRTFTFDQLNQAGADWAAVSSRDGLDVNPMDTTGMLYSIAGNFIATGDPEDGLFVWIEHTA